MPDYNLLLNMLLIISLNIRNKEVPKLQYPTEEQLFGLYRFLVFLRNSDIFWFSVEMRGDRILVKAEEPKGEIDIRIFYVYESGEVKPDDFRDEL